jgi:hypothetical protein
MSTLQIIKKVLEPVQDTKHAPIVRFSLSVHVHKSAPYPVGMGSFCFMTLLQKGRFTIFARREWEKTDRKAQNICRIFTEIPKTSIKVRENFVLFLKNK